MLKALITAVLVLLSAPAAANVEQMQSIRKIECAGGSQGSGFIVSKDTVATAAHVADEVDCVDSETKRPMTTTHMDPDHDFALMRMDTTGMSEMLYSCQRFMTGKTYISLGYPAGRWGAVTLRATRNYTPADFLVWGHRGATYMGRMRHHFGWIVPGASGGPIVSLQGRAHGVNNVVGWHGSYSYELADTILCEGR